MRLLPVEKEAIRDNIKAAYILWFSKDKHLTQGRDAIPGSTDAEVDVFMDYFERYFRRLIFIRRLKACIQHPIAGYRELKRDHSFLHNLDWHNWPK